jgi:hypothetical protein
MTLSYLMSGVKCSKICYELDLRAESLRLNGFQVIGRRSKMDRVNEM